MRPLQCVDPRDAVAIGSVSDHPDRCFRQAPPLPRVRKSERACNPQTSTAANSVADYEALITCVSQLSEGFLKKNTGIDRNLHSANDPRLSVEGGSALIRDYLVLKFTSNFQSKMTRTRHGRERREDAVARRFDGAKEAA